MILVLVRALALACRGHHELVLENLALRQQLHALRRTVGRSHLRRRDRLFWNVVAQTWRNWRAALVLVKPDTVVRGAMASRMASPAMDAAFGADSCGPPKDQRRHSHPRAQDGRRESALGSASDPWRIAETGRRGLGANGLATAPGVWSASDTNVAHVPDESRH